MNFIINSQLVFSCWQCIDSYREKGVLSFYLRN